MVTIAGLVAGIAAFLGAVWYALRRAEKHGSFEREKGRTTSFQWPGDGPSPF